MGANVPDIRNAIRLCQRPFRMVHPHRRWEHSLNLDGRIRGTVNVGEHHRPLAGRLPVRRSG